MANKRLKRGINALLEKSSLHAKSQISSPAEAIEVLKQNEELRNLPVEWLTRGKYQPRRDMTEEGLDELAESIRSQGVIQPIVVRPIASERYEIIAGERRWRAAQRAGLKEVPCVIRDIPDEAAIAMALVENIQREDLNVVEEAMALQRLMDEFGLTHQQVAEAVGKSRTTVTNLLRLLNLAPEVRTMLERGDLDMGHARALLTLPEAKQITVARQVVDKGLTVRETERLVKKTLQGKSTNKTNAQSDADVARLSQQLSEQLGTPVQIRMKTKNKGEVVIRYANLEVLEGLLARLGIKSTE
ncbi:MAG: ParB/RepB/Spo0J family partition protein [Gammaproteobacteria bacterium]|nr:MAG: ParB/RepB/Spo0J family partition protein [Gammaproteobacteria bacterium]